MAMRGRTRHPTVDIDSLTEEERVKLAALRETINRSIERGGSYTDEEVAAYLDARMDAWERRQRKDS